MGSNYMGSRTYSLSHFSPFPRLLWIMTEISSIVGIVFMVIGSLLVSLGLFLCYTTKGEYYNQDEVQAMVTAEVLEEEKKRREENAQIEAEMAEAAAAMQSQQLEPE